jgi:DNA-binding transcriptional LysR family regulator
MAADLNVAPEADVEVGIMTGRRIVNLDIDALRTFVTLAETQSFTLTAELVARTQSTVSAQIKKLEDRLGFLVFERNTRSFAVTQRGEVLLGYAREVLRLHDEGVQRVLHGTVGGTIRLGITDYFVPHALPALLMQFRALYPDARVEVTSGVTGDLLARKKAGEFDIVIGRRDAGAKASGPAKSAPIVLRRERLQWVGSRKAASERALSQTQKQSLPLAVLPVGCGVRAQAVQSLDRAKRGWYVAYCGQSILALQAAIVAGVGVGALTESAITDDMTVLGKRQGLPALVDSEIVIYPAAAPDKQVEVLTELLANLFANAAKE